MCPGVATTSRRSPSTSTTSPADQPLVAEPVRRVERADAGAGQLGEPARALAVVEVAVGEQHGRHRRAAPLDGPEHRPQVPLVVRAGVDHDRAAAPGRDSTQVLVPSSVIGLGLGASTQCAHGATSPPVHASSVTPAAWRIAAAGAVAGVVAQGPPTRPNLADS